MKQLAPCESVEFALNSQGQAKEELAVARAEHKVLSEVGWSFVDKQLLVLLMDTVLALASSVWAGCGGQLPQPKHLCQ